VTWSRWPVHRRVLVNMEDGRAFDAVLFDQRGPLLVLRNATLLTPNEEPALVDGEVVIERDKVAFIQVHT
jgi:small nuclear ribonucleoprotein (snRNP)-like protein